MNTLSIKAFRPQLSLLLWRSGINGNEECLPPDVLQILKSLLLWRSGINGNGNFQPFVEITYNSRFSSGEVELMETLLAVAALRLHFLMSLLLWRSGINGNTAIFLAIVSKLSSLLLWRSGINGNTMNIENLVKVLQEVASPLEKWN